MNPNTFQAMCEVKRWNFDFDAHAFPWTQNLQFKFRWSDTIDTLTVNIIAAITTFIFKLKRVRHNGHDTTGEIRHPFQLL